MSEEEGGGGRKREEEGGGGRRWEEEGGRGRRREKEGGGGRRGGVRWEVGGRWVGVGWEMALKHPLKLLGLSGKENDCKAPALRACVAASTTLGWVSMRVSLRRGTIWGRQAPSCLGAHADIAPSSCTDPCLVRHALSFSLGLANVARQVILRMLKPLFLSYMTSYDMTSNVWRGSGREGERERGEGRGGEGEKG